MAQNGKYKKHRKNLSRSTLQSFFALSLVSFAFVAGIAMLSRAELRLAGASFAAGPEELPFLFALDPPPVVHKIADRSDVRIYLLQREEKTFIVRAEIVDGVWEVTKVERGHE